tara:strand:- start:350 stop:697 length:348 start_codon:yes stop_codon:yes gene_type:complete
MKETIVFKCKVLKPMYDVKNTKYIDFEIDNSIQARIHTLYVRDARRYKLVIPPEPPGDNCLSVKVPWRYNRVDCAVSGIIPVQNLKIGDTVEPLIEYCGTWALGMFWKLSAITAC